MPKIKDKKAIFIWALVLINIIPISLMIWASFLDAGAINSQKFMPSRERNSVVYFKPEQNGGELVATSLGHVQLFPETISQPGVQVANLKSIATVYAKEDDKLWAFSANKGLVKINVAKKQVEEKYDWSFFEKSYQKFDPTLFSASDEVLQKDFVWLSEQLNSSSAIPIAGDVSISSIIDIKFYPSSELIGQLNWILMNKNSLNALFNYWALYEDWLNPKISKLLKKQDRSDIESRFLFRWIIAELFPNSISRFRYFPWQDIWETQVAASGLSLAVADNKVIMGIRGGFFPGIAVFDPDIKKISWITEAKGLPSASIQHIVQISDHEVLVIHDIGLCILQFNSGKITKNFFFGNKLPYIDGQDLLVGGVDGNYITLSYATGSIAFNFRSGETVDTEAANNAASNRISSFYSKKNEKWFGLNDGSLFVLDNDGNILRESKVKQGNRTFRWRNYKDIMEIIPLGTYIRNSLVISVTVSLLCVFFALLPSYALARFKFDKRKIFSKVILSTQLFAGPPYLIPVFIVFTIIQMNGWHIFNSYKGIIFVNLAFFLPLTIQFILSAFRNIPKNLEEIAITDGCTQLQVYKVILRQMLPSIVSCFVYIFLFVWDEIIFIWVLSTDAYTATLPVGIRLSVGHLASRPDLIMALSVIATLPTLLLFAFTGSFFIKSVGNKK